MLSRVSRIALGFLVLAHGAGLAADEKTLLAEVDPAALERHAREIVQYRRDGGTPDEHAAVDYVARTLRAEGIRVDVHEFRAYVSFPGRCALQVEGAEPSSPQCKTQALAAATSDGPVRGEVVFVGAGEKRDYRNVDVRGKVALVDALPLPDGVKHAEDAGAIGAIFMSGMSPGMSGSELIQELTVSPIWGTPTHRNVGELPKIPSVNVKQADGEALREAAGSTPVTVAIETEVDTGFRTLRLPVATIESEKDREGYVLVGGHIDGWHYAGVDEGASNAAMVELARIFHRHRGELERSLKVAWWPAHSNGRYAGSAWFVDHSWLDLQANALAYMNIDGVGQIGATEYRSSNTPAMDELAASVLRDVASVEAGASRPGRNSDQGFYGIGLPLLQFNHGRNDPGGRYWFWHTEEDTFDKIDFDILAGDTRLYVSALSRLLGSPIPPLRLSADTAELKARLEERRGWAGSHLDLSAAITSAGELDALARSLDARLSTSSPSSSADIVRQMVRVLRPVLRVTYQEYGPYHQDPALEVPTLPGLADLETLRDLPAGSDGYELTRTHLVREVNRLRDHIQQALAEARALERLLEESSSN